MEDEQRRIYNAMKRDMVCMLNKESTDAVTAGILATYGIKPLIDSLTEDDYTVVSNLATTLKIRLQQITSGFVKTATGAEVDIPSIKHDWLRGELPLLTEPDGDHKVVIFSKYIHDVSSILDLCTKQDIGAVRLDGRSQKFEKASDTVRRFQTDPGIRVLVSNIQVAATGFTMTAADASVFFSNSYRYDHRVQAVKRTHRIGATRPVRYYDLIAAAVDESILTSLSTTQGVAVNTLDQLREMVDAL